MGVATDYPKGMNDAAIETFASRLLINCNYIFFCEDKIDSGIAVMYAKSVLISLPLSIRDDEYTSCITLTSFHAHAYAHPTNAGIARFSLSLTPGIILRDSTKVVAAQGERSFIKILSGKMDFSPRAASVVFFILLSDFNLRSITHLTPGNPFTSLGFPGINGLCGLRGPKPPPPRQRSGSVKMRKAENNGGEESTIGDHTKTHALIWRIQTHPKTFVLHALDISLGS